MERQTITINGRTLVLRPGMQAAELKRRAGVDAKRLILAHRPDGRWQVVADDEPVPGPDIIDAPRFIYG